MDLPILGKAADKGPTQCTISHALLHVIAVCGCPAKLVLVVPLQGYSECMACHQKYRLRSASFELVETPETPDMSNIKVNVAVEPLNLIVVAPSPPSTTLVGPWKN